MNAVLYADSDGLHHEISPELISSSSCLPQDEVGSMKACLVQASSYQRYLQQST